MGLEKFHQVTVGKEGFFEVFWGGGGLEGFREVFLEGFGGGFGGFRKVFEGF